MEKYNADNDDEGECEVSLLFVLFPLIFCCILGLIFGVLILCRKRKALIRREMPRMKSLKTMMSSGIDVFRFCFGIIKKWFHAMSIL